MSLWNKITNEFVDIIEWLDSSSDVMVWRFPRYQNEIKHGAKLVVRPSQVAIFVNEGQIADVFNFPGTYTLETKNLPILSTLKGWKYGFNSPFKAEVYFVNMRQFTDLKWGTKNPVMLRDSEFGMVRLRAFGTYVLRVKNAPELLREIVGTNHRFSTDDITNQLRNTIISRFTNIVAESKIPALDLAANYDALGQFVTQKIQPELDRWGLDLVSLLVENISLPPEVEAAMDKRTSMGIVGDLSRFTQFQAAQSMEKAAENPGGTAGAGMGFGMGMVMANQMGQTSQTGAPSQAPPPLPAGTGELSIFVALDGKQAGPFNLAALQDLARQSRLTRDTLVWQQGMANWSPASQVASLASLFDSVPPPLPPM
jgi:membrane protease subunit (stomatin/prohibitin family)